MKFRMKPVIKEAIQFDGTDASVDKMLDAWGPKFQRAMSAQQEFGKLRINTLEGVVIASINDWVVKGIKGEFYPIRNDIFLETYEAVMEVSKDGHLQMRLNDD